MEDAWANHESGAARDFHEEKAVDNFHEAKPPSVPCRPERVPAGGGARRCPQASSAQGVLWAKMPEDPTLHAEWIDHLNR